MKSITVPPMSAIIPLTIKMVAINKPEKAKPTVIPMLLRDSLMAVSLIEANLITLGQMFMGINISQRSK